MNVQYLLRGAFFFVAGLLAACGGGGGDANGGGDNPNPPTVNNFQADPSATSTNTPVTFSWDVSDADGDTLTCSLDVDGDSAVDHIISDCANTTSQTHTYATAGSYTARLTVDDGNGGTADGTVTVTVANTVANTPPVFDSDFSVTSNPVGAGSPVTFSWDVSDADGDTLSCTLDVNDDGTPDYTIDDCANTGSQTHTYATAGSYTARLTVDDGNGGMPTQTVAITVNAVAGNTPPVFGTPLGATPASLREGETVTYAWTVSDADNDTLTCTLDVDGDGTADHTYSDCASVTSQAHVFTTAGIYAATLTASDGKGGNVSSGPVSVTVAANKAPTFGTPLGATPASLREGETVTYAWTVSDADNDTLTCTLDVDGDGTADHTYSDCASVTSQAHVFTTAGIYAATLTASDGKGGNVSSGPVSVTVAANKAPTFGTPLGATPASLREGETVTYAWTVSDADNDTLTCTLDVDGDGTADHTYSDCASVTTQAHVYSTAGTYTATLSVSDGKGGSAQSSTSVTVEANAAPVFATDLGVSQATVTLGNPVTFGWLVSDADGDTLSCTLDIDTSDAGSTDYTFSDCASVTSQAHTYAAAGTYTSRLTVTDGNGGSVVQSVSVTVDSAANVAPVIDSALGVNPDPVISGRAMTFAWDVSDANGDTLTCTLDIDTADGGSSNYVINDCGNTASRSHTYSQSGTYTASLSVDDGTAAPVVSTVTFTVIAPLSTDVSVDGPAVAGERLLYTITVANATASPINDVAVSFVVPAELSFSATSDAEPNTSCNGPCDLPEEASWSLGTLAAGEGRTITVNALVDAATLNGVAVTLPVTFSAAGISDVQINKVVGVFNTPSADLALSASTDPVVPNETFTYQLDFGNTSAGSLTTVELRAFLPSGVTVSSISDGGIEVNPGEVVWNEGSLGVGASLHREITVTADAGLTAGHILKTTAQLTHGGGLAVDNSAEHVLNVVSSALPLEVDISTSANPVVADERALYTLTISNSSLLPVNDVYVQLRLPAELSFSATSDAEPNTSCNGPCDLPEEAGWSLGTLAAGESRTITVNALVASVLSGNLITTPVRVTATGLGDTIDLLKTVAVYNTPSADLSLSASTNPVVPNETFTYQLDFGNTSGGPLTTAELRAFLPSGVTVSSISDGGTEVNPGEVVWNEASLGVGASLHREITVIADAGLTAGQILKTTAQLTHDGGLAVDNTAEHALTVVSSALPLEVDISTSSNPVVANERVLYTLTISNSSLQPVNGVNVQLRLPAELSFSAISDAEPNTSCNGPCNLPEEASWDLGTLAAGESRTIAVNALVASVLDGNLITTPVRVTATDLGDTINLLSTVAVFSSPSADLALSASTDPVVANETFTYQLDFGNTSAGSLSAVELRAFLPSGVTVSSISDGGTEVNPGEVVWNEASLGVGASLHREITVIADAGLTAGQILKTTAQLTHDGGLAVDNTAEHALTVVSSALPLEVDISTSSNPVVANERVLYTLTISNSSLQPVNGVNVQLRLPAELSFSAISDAEPNTSCNGPCNLPEEASWDLGTLAAGESRTIAVNALVASVLDGNLITTPVRVTATDLGDTINLLNTVAVFSSPSVDLALSASTDPVVANETFTYQLDFGNTSAGSLSAVELRAFLPSGVTVSSISDGGTEVNPGEVVWNVAALNVGASVHHEITVVADGATAGDILMLSAELSYDGGLEIDNRSEFAVSVAESAGIASLLSVDITATPQPVASSGILAYTITVTNGYGLPVDDVNVQLRLPAEFSFSATSDAEPNTSCNGPCDLPEEASWSLGTMAAGTSQVITINATVAAGLDDGTLIVAPVRVTATGMQDTIDLRQVTAVGN